MLVTQSKKGTLFPLCANNLQGEMRLPSRNILKLHQNTETIERLQQEILCAFEKSEQDNEQKLSRITDTMINQTVESILEAERESDEKFKEIISSLPYYNEPGKHIKLRYYSHQLSADLISRLK